MTTRRSSSSSRSRLRYFLFRCIFENLLSYYQASTDRLGDIFAISHTHLDTRSLNIFASKKEPSDFPMVQMCSGSERHTAAASCLLLSRKKGNRNAYDSRPHLQPGKLHYFAGKFYDCEKHVLSQLACACFLKNLTSRWCNVHSTSSLSLCRSLLLPSASLCRRRAVCQSKKQQQQSIYTGACFKC